MEKIQHVSTSGYFNHSPALEKREEKKNEEKTENKNMSRFRLSTHQYFTQPQRYYTAERLFTEGRAVHKSTSVLTSSDLMLRLNLKTALESELATGGCLTLAFMG